MNIKELLRELPVFAALTDEELQIVATICKTKTVPSGEFVFKEGSRGDDLFVVINGCVRIFTQITENVDKTLITLRNGGLFGEMAIISEDYRSASAQAMEETELVLINQNDFENLLKTELLAGRKILDAFVKILSDRLKKTTELYWQAVDWGLSISGILDLNYSQLINHREQLEILLNSGEKISGVLLKAEKNNFGSEFLIQLENERLMVIPYGAISSISFNQPPVDPDKEV